MRVLSGKATAYKEKFSVRHVTSTFYRVGGAHGGSRFCLVFWLGNCLGLPVFRNMSTMFSVASIHRFSAVP